MQSKGWIRFVAILLAIASIWQLSFTLVTRLQENKAAKAAMKAANLEDMEVSMPIAMTFQPSKLPVFFVSCKYPPAVRPCRPFARRPAVF